jgi:class 3 adenylate cyclase
MFADMVGYTALMQEDERQAKLQRDRNKAVLVQTVPDHGGKILQFYGDGALSVFPSAIAAAECAIQIQAELQPPLLCRSASASTPETSCTMKRVCSVTP